MKETIADLAWKCFVVLVILGTNIVIPLLGDKNPYFWLLFVATQEPLLLVFYALSEAFTS